jgi:hypothetical protein
MHHLDLPTDEDRQYPPFVRVLDSAVDPPLLA